MTTNEKRKIDSIMADALAMATHANVAPELVSLWFSDALAASGTLDYARNLRRAMATACLLAQRGFPPHMDAHTMAGLTGI